ncbi:MAG: hypothetical protein Q4F23_02465 [Coriobacteriia bacterium]|nr:hypothetical protein [Coriobacteriia bacterium]
MAYEANILSFDEVRTSVASRTQGAYAATAPSRHSGESVASRRSSYERSSYGPSRARGDRARSSRESNERAASTRRQMGAYSEEAERRSEMLEHSSRGDRTQSRRSSFRSSDSDRGAFGQLRHKMRSSKAERQFERTVGREDVRRSQDQAGSRAALYEMKMGREHRRSAQMQEQEHSGKKFRTSSLSDFFAGGRLMRWGIASLLLVVALGVFVYQPAADLYNEVRSLQQLQAQYEVTEASYNQVKADVDYLSTEDGLADYAHQQLGWLRSGEHAVTVKGLSEEAQDSSSSTTSVIDSIAQSKVEVPAPDTWYSGVLDVVFGYGK